MTLEPGWVPDGVDIGKANTARVYDYWLGGDHNFQADRDMARAAIALDPNMRTAVRAIRAFLGRSVRYLAADAGIRQFLDIGSGIPTNQNVHEVAQDAAPGARVVYADIDDIAVAHSRLLLRENKDAAVLQADIRRPAEILGAPETQLLLDFDQPVAVILSAVLHFVPDDAEAAPIVAALRDALAPGSYLVLCHGCLDGRPQTVADFQKVYNNRVSTQYKARTRDQIEHLLNGFTLLEPGLVWVPEWRPDSPNDVPDNPETYGGLVGVARYDGPLSSG